MAYNSIATNPGVMPFIMALPGEKDPNSAQTVAARAAAGDSTPPSPVQPGVGAVAPFSTETITDPTNQTTKIVEDARTKSAEASMGEAKAARLDAVDMQAEADKEAEMNAALKAQEEAKAMAAENSALKANQVERDRRLQEATAREAAQQAAVEKAAKPTGYWQDMSTPRRVLAAIFMGMDASQGSNNVAKIYGDYAAEDRQRKMDALNFEAQKLAAAGKDRARIQEYYQQRAEEISREEIANGKIMVKQIEASGKKFPQWAAKAEVAKAAILDDTAGKEQSHAIQMAAKLTHEDRKRTVSETTGKEAAGGAPRQTTKEEEEAIVAESNADLFKRAAEAAKRNPAAVKELNEAIKAELENANLDKTGMGGALRAVKGVGGAPTSIDQRLKSDDARLLFRATKMAGAMNAKSIDSGALSDKTIEVGDSMVGAASASPQELSATFGGMEAKQGKIAAAKRKAAQPAQESPQPQPSNATSSSSGLTKDQAGKLTPSERTVYLEAKAVKPGHPDYVEAQMAIKNFDAKMKGGK